MAVLSMTRQLRPTAVVVKVWPLATLAAKAESERVRTTPASNRAEVLNYFGFHGKEGKNIDKGHTKLYSTKIKLQIKKIKKIKPQI